MLKTGVRLNILQSTASEERKAGNMANNASRAMPANVNQEAGYESTSNSGNLGSIPAGVANFVHEITNPLTNLSLTLQLFERRITKINEHVDPLVLSMVQQMTTEIDRMQFLISSVRASFSESKALKEE